MELQHFLEGEIGSDISVHNEKWLAIIVISDKLAGFLLVKSEMT